MICKHTVFSLGTRDAAWYRLECSTDNLPGLHRPVDSSPAYLRRGIISVFSAFLLATVFAFVAFSVDTGLIVWTQTNMQNAADAASLAAAQELASVVVQSGEDQGEPSADPGSKAVAKARDMAENVAARNGAYVDPNSDVTFGRRSFDAVTNTWPIVWGQSPFNVVKVTVRRDNQDTSQADGKLRLAFGWAVGKSTANLRASASAFVEARDIVTVLDYSGSMNYDSQYRADTLATLGQTALEANLHDIWQDLGSPTYGNLPYEPTFATVTKSPGSIVWPGPTADITFAQNVSSVKLTYSGGGSQSFTGGTPGQVKTYQGTGSYSGKVITKADLKVGSTWTSYNFNDTNTIKAALGLSSVPYPYPSGSWSNYIDYCRDSTGATSWYDSQISKAGYRRKFGMKTLVEFWMKHFKQFSETPDHWKTRHYPFHAVKEGASLLCDFLEDLDYGDHLGLVTYDTNSRIETCLCDAGMPSVDLGSHWITDDYNAIDTIQRHKQAGHYGDTTNIGGGLTDAINLLQDHGRYGARPTIILMTDGNANVHDPSYSLPPDWNWNSVTDFDGDGTADYSTSDPDAMYAIGRAKEAADLGIRVHSLGVGANADTALLQAIAHIGGGIYIEVPGGTSVSQMENEVRAAFREIAAKLPPPKLVYEE